MRFPHRHRRLQSLFVVSLMALVLGGCEVLGIDDPAKVAAAKEADGKAVGGACRHSGRALEDCYQMNPKAVKAAVFAGWRDMDAYMRENKIDVVTPQFVNPQTGGKGENAVAAGKSEGTEKKAPEEKKGAVKHSALSGTSAASASRRLT